MLKSHKGGILIVVLLMVSFILSAAIAMHEKSSLSYGATSEMFSDNQGAIYAATAITAVRSLMEYDDAEYDALDDIWVTLPSMPVEKGTVTATIQAVDAKLSLNSVHTKDEEKVKRVAEAFSYIFDEQGVDENVWLAMVDWVMDGDSRPMSTEVQGVVFNEQGNSYTAKFSNLSTLMELRLVPGMTDVWEQVSPYVTAGDPEPKININLADNLTIQALMPELTPYMTQIMDSRDEAPFKSKDALYTLLGTNNKEMYNKILPFFDVKSTLFYLRIEVNILDSVQYYHVLLRRNGKRLTVLSYIEGGSNDYY